MREARARTSCRRPGGGAHTYMRLAVVCKHERTAASERCAGVCCGRPNNRAGRRWAAATTVGAWVNRCACASAPQAAGGVCGEPGDSLCSERAALCAGGEHGLRARWLRSHGLRRLRHAADGKQNSLAVQTAGDAKLRLEVRVVDDAQHRAIDVVLQAGEGRAADAARLSACGRGERLLRGTRGRGVVTHSAWCGAPRTQDWIGTVALAPA